MEQELASADVVFRDVTPEEVAHFRKFGWVRLKQFFSPTVVAELLAMAKNRMGEKGDKNLPPEAFLYFNPLTMNGLDDPLLRPVIDQCGRGARALMARRVPTGIRYFTDYFAVKQPARSRQEGKGGAGASDWHQDFAAAASDRSGGMVFWAALTDMTPDNGTMAFINGSHRYGVMGHFTTHASGSLLDEYPELLEECTSTGNLSYRAGDVTVHSNMVVHSAAANVTDDPRWTYIVIVNPADACWTGAVADAFTNEGLTVRKPFPDDRFPIIG